MARARKKKSGFWAWSEIHNGGKTKEIRGRKVVVERNMASCGDEVTQEMLKLSDDDWERMIANGSIRPYPFPMEARENESPSSFILRELLEGKEQLDANLMLEMSLMAPEIGAIMAEDEAELAASELAEA